MTPSPRPRPRLPRSAAALAALLLAAACAAGAPRTQAPETAPETAAAQPAGRLEAVELASSAPADLAALREGDAPARAVDATLHLPADTRGRMPAVVVLEDGDEGAVYAHALAEAGIAALAVPSEGGL
ncbi:hypothetical protein, partial [Arenibaculum sp.]|uniref:hypothetical protein n=1 Tax=Arenibaculum sp. TaxID=2865862 RepID=UPI0033803070|nr:hypothetical protein [Arenibaculum sp.]